MNLSKAAILVTLPTMLGCRDVEQEARKDVDAICSQVRSAHLIIMSGGFFITESTLNKADEKEVQCLGISPSDQEKMLQEHIEILRLLAMREHAFYLR